MWDEIIYPFPMLLEFGNGYVNSYQTLLGVWLLIHGGIEVNPLLFFNLQLPAPWYTALKTWWSLRLQMAY